MLSADFGHLERDTRMVDASAAEWVHIDVMDGVFVPNITFGIKMVEDIRKCTSLPIDAHLMIVHPEKYVERFAKAGADYITVHYEACGTDTAAVLKLIGDCGAKAGVVINPDTPWERAAEFLQLCDMVLVMSVYPGFGGQKFMADQMPKVAAIRKLINERNPACELEVDGGVAPDTCQTCIDAGANVLVAGSAVYKAEDIPARIKELRGK